MNGSVQELAQNMPLSKELASSSAYLQSSTWSVFCWCHTLDLELPSSLHPQMPAAAPPLLGIPPWVDSLPLALFQNHAHIRLLLSHTAGSLGCPTVLTVGVSQAWCSL